MREKVTCMQTHSLSQSVSRSISQKSGVVEVKSSSSSIVEIKFGRSRDRQASRHSSLCPRPLSPTALCMQLTTQGGPPRTHNCPYNLIITELRKSASAQGRTGEGHFTSYSTQSETNYCRQLHAPDGDVRPAAQIYALTNDLLGISIPNPETYLDAMHYACRLSCSCVKR